MEKRVILAVVLCIGVVALWTQVFPPPPPPRPPAPASAPASGSAPAAAPAAPGAPGPAEPGAPAPAPVAANAPPEPEREIEVLTKDVRFVFSTMGGTLRHAQLLE